jgi:GNAT superfamily N-acetyltransferase
VEPEEPEVVTVRDGSVLFVRRVHPSDKPHFERGFAKLSRESKYFRFLADRKELTEADLEYLTEVDGDNHYAVVAFVVDPAGEIEGIGVARYVRLADRPEAAEVAVTVADAWQRRGIGTMLYDRLLAAARESGIKILRSDIHFENRGIRELLEKAAPATVIERDGVVVTLELSI